MQRYIEQLIEDIHKASWNTRAPHEIWELSEADPDDEIDTEDLSYVEQCIYGEEIPISEITGIEAITLPPPEKLNDEQQTLLVVELEKLLLNYHFHLDFPTNYPLHLRYPFIRDLWSESHVPLSIGENHIEFCSYEEESCPFPGYCKTCEEVAFEMENGAKCPENNIFDPDELLPF